MAGNVEEKCLALNANAEVFEQLAMRGSELSPARRWGRVCMAGLLLGAAEVRGFGLGKWGFQVSS